MINSANLAVVVGASGAFGAAITKRLVEEGLRVLAVARNAEGLSRLRDELGEHVEPCVADVTDDRCVGTISDAIDGRPVRMIVHGPGVIVAGGILTAPVDAILTSVHIKVGGLIRLVRACDPNLSEGSRIVAIAGHYGLEPTQYAATAGVANAALIAAVRQLSLAYGARGVTAHTLAPGPGDTPRLWRVAEDRAVLNGTTAHDVVAQMRASSSIGQLTSPHQVAWAVATLLAPEASVMTGSTLMLEAGRRRGLP